MASKTRSLAEWCAMTQEELQAEMIEAGYATKEQQARLSELGFSGGLATLTQERATQLIAESEERHRLADAAEAKKVEQLRLFADRPKRVFPKEG